MRWQAQKLDLSEFQANLSHKHYAFDFCLALTSPSPAVSVSLASSPSMQHISRSKLVLISNVLNGEKIKQSVPNCLPSRRRCHEDTKGKTEVRRFLLLINMRLSFSFHCMLNLDTSVIRGMPRVSDVSDVIFWVLILCRWWCR